MASEFESEGLLEGTEGRDREARLKLLEELADDGVSLEDIRRAVEEDRLALLPVERFLGGGGQRYTIAEIAEEAGVDVELVLRLRQAIGLPRPDPDEPTGTEEDLEASRRLRMLLSAGLPEAGLVENSRVIGLAAAQVAASANALVGDALLQPGDTELEAAHRYLEAARALQPLLGPALVWAVNRHLVEQIRQAVLSSAQLREGRPAGAQEVSACFADLVDFTRLGQTLDHEQLGSLTTRLGELVGETVESPVRVVKMIGDAAMLVSSDNDALLEVALELVDAASKEGDGFPALRAGLARGEAISRGGDWYGHPINLASRIADFAFPESVLCSEEVHDAAADGFTWSYAGERKLKGVTGGVKLFRARHEGAQAG
jgi:adenylate cyclase